jgi:hypothetical protein
VPVDEASMTLRTLPLPLKVLATCFLLTIGIGYLFGLIYLYLIDLEPHAKEGLSLLQSVIVKYYGKREASRLEAALEGPMGEYVTPSEKERITRWIKLGAGEATFADVQPILTKACASCHRPESGMPIPPLTSYAEVAPYTSMDLGQSIRSLVRVSHIHLFGMSFIFMLTSLIFAFSEISRLLRSMLIAIPFVAIWLDIGSWWFTKYQPVFAYTVIAGGALMGLSLAGQIVIALHEMWLAPLRARSEE